MPKAKSKNSERISSGIPGLDKLIEGGFFRGSTVLVSGAAGTGKTIFCSQYLWEGLKSGENCMFITLEEKPDDIIGDVKRFGWDFAKYIKDRKLTLEYQDPFQITDISSPLLDKIREYKVQRVAIDSTALFGMYYKDAFEVRKQLFKLLSGLKEIGVTSVLTSEVPDGSKALTRFGVEEFVTDGLIMFDYDILRPNPLQLIVRKMRRTKHYRKSVVMEITDKGINLKSQDIK
ncbi:MAG: ATPase domain-containing protein [Candidatus Aenigmatarchaeota archaeon]